jgi:uncharacterized Zn ribbon protein
METKDSVGNKLNDGDTIIISKTLKRGDSQNIECRIGKSMLVIKTQFVKKG